MGAADGGFDAVAVVLLQHAEVFVAELVGHVFDGQPGVGHQAGGGMAQQVGDPATLDASGGDKAVEFVADGLWGRRAVRWVR